MTTPIEQLRTWMAQIHDLRDAALILDWDQHTMMPRRGGENRAEALATLERIRHEKFVSGDTGSLIDGAEKALNGASPDSDDARLVAVTRRRWEKARRVPTDLAAEMARAGSIGQEVWIQARAENDYRLLRPLPGRGTWTWFGATPSASTALIDPTTSSWTTSSRR